MGKIFLGMLLAMGSLTLSALGNPLTASDEVILRGQIVRTDSGLKYLELSRFHLQLQDTRPDEDLVWPDDMYLYVLSEYTIHGTKIDRESRKVRWLENGFQGSIFQIDAEMQLIHTRRDGPEQVWMYFHQRPKSSQDLNQALFVKLDLRVEPLQFDPLSYRFEQGSAKFPGVKQYYIHPEKMFEGEQIENAKKLTAVSLTEVNGVLAVTLAGNESAATLRFDERKKEFVVVGFALWGDD